MKRTLMEKLKPYLMLLPAFIGIGAFTIYPIIKVIVWSLYKVNQLNPSKTKFVGLTNFQYLLTNKNFLKTLGNTGVYTFWTVVIILLVALVLAVWLSKKQDKMTRFTQAAAFTPHIISMVSIAMVFAQMMNPNFGLFNEVLEKLGLPRLQWLQSSSTAMGSVVFVASWKSIGYYSLIIMSSMKSIPTEIYEAARLDGSSSVKTFFKITLPMISPQLFFLLITITTGSFKVFDSVRIMTNGGPGDATRVLSMYIYDYAFQRNNTLGYACAAGVIMLLILVVVTVFDFAFVEKKVHYQ